jgi:hypothetical protein
MVKETIIEVCDDENEKNMECTKCPFQKALFGGQWKSKREERPLRTFYTSHPLSLDMNIGMLMMLM